MRVALATSLVVINPFVVPIPAAAQSGGVLVVGVRQAPPFAILEDGVWSGIAIELWTSIAADLRYDYELREYGLDSLLSAVSDGSVQVGLGALTVTGPRELTTDFTHPFHIAGLGIAVRNQRAGIVRTALDGLFSMTFLRVMGGLVLLLGLAGVFVWLFERRRNATQFGRGIRGIGEGFWWAAVTMTTVGYGDRAPTTFGGRFVAFLWMFASIIMISGFTAGIATALTVSGLDSNVRGLQDLPHVATGTVVGSIAEAALLRRGVQARPYNDLESVLAALDAGELDAVVYDRPLLRYHATTTFGGRLRILPTSFARQNYSIVLGNGSALREPINLRLLEITASSTWSDVLTRYLGAEPE